MVSLYAWANPLRHLHLADHTWVSTYDAPSGCPPPTDYWYCTGACHPTGAGTTARALRTGRADLALAHCIAQPNVSTFHPGPATAGIHYGIDGVCHQISNRVLFATSIVGDSLTVSGAHGYHASRFLSGKYGSNVAQWHQLLRRCTGTPAARSGDEPMDDLEQMIAEALGPNYDRTKLDGVRAVQAELIARKDVLDAEVQRGERAGGAYADAVNDLLNEHLTEVANILGAEDYRRVFQLEPGEPISVVDPRVANEIEYRKPRER